MIFKVEDFRNTRNILGQSKNLGQGSSSRPFDMVYGKSSASKGIGAGEIIKGKYTDEQNRPDRDLGKSITPGFRNISFEVSNKKLLKICAYFYLLILIIFSK